MITIGSDAGSCPKDLSSFRGFHDGATIIVCGCGESLNDLTHPERFITIGVNDVGRRFHPDYLVVVNPRDQFSGDRFHYVETSQARYLFTQIDLGVAHPHIVKFRLGSYGGTDLSVPDVLHYTQNSPYVAMCLAAHMGAKRIGLIGVDFTDNHFFARTGAHALSRHLAKIDKQYRRLGQALGALGIEVFNLSLASRLKAFPKMPLTEFAALAGSAAASSESGATLDHLSRAAFTVVDVTAASALGDYAREPQPKVFGVNYCFLACGDVFSTGLNNAAAELGVEYESALWDDPILPAKIERFRPDLIFVVHGRRFVQRWGGAFSRYNTAVWLVDEPYEVDDTARWSNIFRTVFVNDLNTISRHGNAHYLPVCFDSQVHCDRGLTRIHTAGFIGGYNETRERYLNEMAEVGLLSYVVGGPWKSSTLRRLSLGTNVPPARTTELYQQTRIVVNVFRDIHHFNRERIQARSMNPRIYEALACGALVLSEERPEAKEIFPELPTFDSPHSMVRSLERLIADEPSRSELLEKCRARLAGHSFTDRLARVLQVCLGIDVAQCPTNFDLPLTTQKAQSERPQPTIACWTLETPLREWLGLGDAARVGEGGEIELFKPHSNDPGSETGLVSAQSYNDVEVSFDLWLDSDTWFITKIHQLDRTDQKTNSYHIVSEPAASYLARHNHIFRHFSITRGVWHRLAFRWVDQLIEVFVDDILMIRRPDNLLQSGYCFIGVKGGCAKLRKIQLTDLSGIQSNEAKGRSDSGRTPENHITHRSNGGRERRPGIELWPFTAMPRRNLIYHVWPVRGANWQWNLDQLKSRLDVFNGRRILGVVYDERSEPPERVQEYLAGHGFEFVVAKNDERGEAITFPLMIQRVISDDPNDITFYGHAKGVKYGASVSPLVKRWAEVQYRVALDDWLTVRDQMQRFAMTGPFKMLGRFRSHRFLADWHYSGAYFWMRNAYVSSRNYAEVPLFYGGVETWPGAVFRKEETGCLFMDNLRQLPYHEQFWRGIGESAFRQWESNVRPFPPPSDLLQPPPYNGFDSPRMEQIPDEFEWWVNLLLQAGVSRVLTIGASDGGVEWHLAREFFERGRRIEITSIEKSPTGRLRQTFSEAELDFHQSLKVIEADSTSPSTGAQLADQYDAIFIDGEHSYKACRSDFELARSLKPRLIGLHDIVDSDWHTYARCCVSRLWAELCREYQTEQKVSGDWGGIGVVFPSKGDLR